MAIGCSRGAISLLALFVFLGARSAGAATLEDELSDILSNHPQIQAKTKAVKSATEGIRAARAGYYPTVRAGGDQGNEYIDSPDRRSVQGRPFNDQRQTANLTVTQKIFDGFATDSAVDAAKIGRDISTSELNATRQTTLLEGTTAYLDILRQTRLVALSRENERKVAEQLNLEDERVRKGSGITSDVLAAKQRLQIAKERRVNFEGGFHTAVARYTQVFGHAPDVAALTDPPMPLDQIPDSIDDVLAAAEKGNPTLDSATRSIELTDERRRGAEAGYWPTLDLVGKADYENGKNAVIGVRRDWSVLLVANWELFSGFKTNAQVAQASWDHAASRDNRLQTSRKISEAARTAWHKLETARQRLDLLENAANIAEEVWEAQKRKREAGKATVQEVMDEETRINDARINYTGAYFDMYQAAYELLAVMGRLEIDSLKRDTLPPSLERTSMTAPLPSPSPVPAPRTTAPSARPTTATPQPARDSDSDPILAQANEANAAMLARVRSLMLRHSGE